MPILTRIKKPKGGVVFVDGFAGPGEYENGEPGSPVIALNTALAHAHSFPRPVHFLFIEKDHDRWARLCTVIDAMKPRIEAAAKKVHVYDPRNGECADELRKALLATRERHGGHGPWLVFLDQFGYSQVPMALIKEVMDGDSCEVFTYLEVRRLSTYLADEDKWPSINAAFGSDTWKKAIPLSGTRRVQALSDAYAAALRERAGGRYTWHFAMKGDNDALIYWLFFCTKSERGLEEMKKAMAKVDSSGTFAFSDADNENQLSLISTMSDSWLERHLSTHFAGEVRSIAAIREHVLTQTPLITFKKSLQRLESQGLVKVESARKGRRKGAFDDDGMQLRFLGPMSEQRELKPPTSDELCVAPGCVRARIPGEKTCAAHKT